MDSNDYKLKYEEEKEGKRENKEKEKEREIDHARPTPPIDRLFSLESSHFILALLGYTHVRKCRASSLSPPVFLISYSLFISNSFLSIIIEIEIE